MSQKYVFALGITCLSQQVFDELIPQPGAPQNYFLHQCFLVRCTPAAFAKLAEFGAQQAVIVQQIEEGTKTQEDQGDYTAFMQEHDIEHLTFGFDIQPGRITRSAAPYTFDEFDAWVERDNVTFPSETAKEMAKIAFFAARDTKKQ